MNNINVKTITDRLDPLPSIGFSTEHLIFKLSCPELPSQFLLNPLYTTEVSWAKGETYRVYLREASILAYSLSVKQKYKMSIEFVKDKKELSEKGFYFLPCDFEISFAEVEEGVVDFLICNFSEKIEESSLQYLKSQLGVCFNNISARQLDTFYESCSKMIIKRMVDVIAIHKDLVSIQSMRAIQDVYEFSARELG